jgi:putative ABC transport system permease protein
MFKHYLKVAFRNLIRSKGFSFINIFGLATGMTTCLLIMLYVVDESSYDRHHADGDKLFRIASETRNETWVATPAPMAEALKKDFPEVVQSTRLLRFPGAEKMLLKYEDQQKQFFETNAYYADSTFFQLFTYEFKAGDITTALNGPNSIVISEDVASKFFGTENPIDKVLKVGLPFGEFQYTVKGVFKNNGNKSHIPANLFLSMVNNDVGGWVKSQNLWATNSIFHTYVKLKDKLDAPAFEGRLQDFLSRNGGEEFKAAGIDKRLFIQPVEDIYLHSDFGYEVAPNGNIKYLYIFSSIAAFVLIIACINFMNLSTARSERRAREVGIRKVNGTNRSSLVAQFLGESLLMSAIALMLTLALTQLLIPAFNQLTDKQLSLLQLPNVFIWLASLTLITGLLAGLYPAFYLSSFQPISVLKGVEKSALSAVAIRKGLVVFQFSISIVLILGAIMVGQQMSFMSSQNLGFEKDKKVILPIQTGEANANSETLKNELLNNSGIVSVTRAGTYPGIESVTSMLFYAEGKSATDNVDVQTIYAEPGYIATLGIELLQGRDFARDFKNDQNSFILNESAIKQLGYTTQTAIGKKVYYEFQNATQSMEIIGVVRDYHFQGLQQKIKPLALAVHPLFSGPSSYLILDVKTTRYSDLLHDVRKTWSKINPGSPFAYSFLDHDFQRNYEKEERTAQLVGYFTLVAIIIACLGLFGLATFTAEQRIKEIGVRKVLGASVSQLVSLLSKDFMKLIGISIVLSSPLAYFMMDKWLEGFAYHIEVHWWVFILTGIGSAGLALITLGFQAIKYALMNPVKSLRSE